MINGVGEFIKSFLELMMIVLYVICFNVNILLSLFFFPIHNLLFTPFFSPIISLYF